MFVRVSVPVTEMIEDKSVQFVVMESIKERSVRVAASFTSNKKESDVKEELIVRVESCSQSLDVMKVFPVDRVIPSVSDECTELRRKMVSADGEGEESSDTLNVILWNASNRVVQLQSLGSIQVAVSDVEGAAVI